MGTHYSNVQNPESLQRRAKAWADEVIKECKSKVTDKQNLFPVFVYRGMSGIGSATGLMLALYNIDPEFKFGMVYVRKEEEQSHGSRIEYQMDSHDGDMRKRFYFVDDFICSGESYARAMRAAFNSFGIRGKKFDASKCGLIEMNRTVDEARQYREDGKLNRAYNRLEEEKSEE